MYAIVHICNLDVVFSKLELAILLTSAACHDLDHPGLTNRLKNNSFHGRLRMVLCCLLLFSYQQNAKTELALKYPHSPLENHHYSVAMQILDMVRPAN